MEYYNNILCITGRELIRTKSNPDGLMSRTIYKRKAYEDQVLNIVRRGGGVGNTVLIAYDSLPPKYKKAAKEKFGDIETTAQKQGIMDYIEEDPEAVKFFASFRIEYSDNTKGLPLEKQTELVNTAKILNALQVAWEEHSMARSRTGKRPLTSEFWTNSVKALNSIKTDLPHDLNYKNWRRLQDKVKTYQKEGYKCLISGRWANSNTVKITPEAGKWLVARWMSKIEIVTLEQLFAEYNQVAEREGWKQLKSSQAVYDYLNRPEIKRIWYAARYGELLSKEIYSRQNRTHLPTLPNALWNSDGTKLNYYYQDENGNMKTTQVYEIMDVATEYLIGCYFSDSEDYEAQYFAFKQAVEHAGFLPYELKYDNQGGHKKLENSNLLKNLSRHAVKTAPYNGKSKTIENAFYRLQSQYLRKDWFFTGQNITAKKRESRQNMEFILANPKKLPTLEEVKARYLQRRKEWNNDPHPKTGISRAEMYRGQVNEKAQKVGILDIIEIFGITTKKPVTYRASGLEIEVKKRTYAYEVLDANGNPDKDFNRRNIGRKFYVRYTPDDMTIVSFYEKDANGLRFVEMGQPYQYVNRALQDQTPEDLKRIRQNEVQNKAERISDERERNNLLEEFGYHPNQHGLNCPKLKGINARKGSRIDIGEILKEVSNMDAIEQQQKAEKRETRKAERKQRALEEQEQEAFDNMRIEYLKSQLTITI